MVRAREAVLVLPHVWTAPSVFAFKEACTFSEEVVAISSDETRNKVQVQTTRVTH